MIKQGLRRVWGIRPGELIRPISMHGRGRSGPCGRGRRQRLSRLRRR